MSPTPSLGSFPLHTNPGLLSFGAGKLLSGLASLGRKSHRASADGQQSHPTRHATGGPASGPLANPTALISGPSLLDSVQHHHQPSLRLANQGAPEAPHAEGSLVAAGDGASSEEDSSSDQEQGPRRRNRLAGHRPHDRYAHQLPHERASGRATRYLSEDGAVCGGHGAQRGAGEEAEEAWPRRALTPQQDLALQQYEAEVHASLAAAAAHQHAQRSEEQAEEEALAAQQYREVMERSSAPAVTRRVVVRPSSASRQPSLGADCSAVAADGASGAAGDEGGACHAATALPRPTVHHDAYVAPASQQHGVAVHLPRPPPGSQHLEVLSACSVDLDGPCQQQGVAVARSGSHPLPLLQPRPPSRTGSISDLIRPPSASGLPSPAAPLVSKHRVARLSAHDGLMLGAAPPAGAMPPLPPSGAGSRAITSASPLTTSTARRVSIC